LVNFKIYRIDSVVNTVYVIHQK